MRESGLGKIRLGLTTLNAHVKVRAKSWIRIKSENLFGQFAWLKLRETNAGNLCLFQNRVDEIKEPEFFR